MRFFTLQLLVNEVTSEGGAKCDPRSTRLAEKALTAQNDRTWWQHTNRMPRNRLPRILKKNYRPTGRRNQGRPLQGLLDA